MMVHPLLLSSDSLLAVSVGGVAYGVVFWLGILALLIILAVIALFLTMFPDLVRYLKIKRM